MFQSPWLMSNANQLTTLSDNLLQSPITCSGAIVLFSSGHLCKLSSEANHSADLWSSHQPCGRSQVSGCPESPPHKPNGALHWDRHHHQEAFSLPERIRFHEIQHLGYIQFVLLWSLSNYCWWWRILSGFHVSLNSAYKHMYYDKFIWIVVQVSCLVLAAWIVKTQVCHTCTTAREHSEVG